MRLTLRTLLAYMDDILEPADHEALGQKIETSDFATELIHRSRDTVRRLRLGAPDLFAGESDDVLSDATFSDANAVAEYLDNTLPPEEVAEFERRCLDSGNEADVHLAEVASCHHILTMVLGEPAEIDAALRQRVQQLPGNAERGQHFRLEQAHTVPEPAPEPTVAAPSPAVSPQSDPEPARVPDYLRAATKSHRRRRRLAVAAVLLVGVVGYFAPAVFRKPELPPEVTQLDESSLGLSIESDSPSTVETSTTDGNTVPDGLSEAPAFSSPDPTSKAPAFVSPEPVVEETPSSPDATEPEVIPDVVVPDPAAIAEIPANSLDTPNELELTEPEMPSELASAGVSPDALPELPETATNSGNAGSGDTEPSALMPEPHVEESSETDTTSVAEVPPPEVPIVEEPMVEEPQGPVQLGSYLGNNDVLLQFNPQREKWIRLPLRSDLMAGSRLLALPKFRTHLILSGTNLYLSGGTQIALPQADQRQSAEEFDLELKIVYGKVLLNADLQDHRIALHIGNQLYPIKLESSSSLAVEVHRIFVPGSDFESESSPIEITWYLTSGSLENLEEGTDQQPITGPITWKTIGEVSDSPVALDRLPNWIDQEPVTDMQKRARTVLVEALEPGQPVGLRLLELNDPREDGRQQEVRTLAAESSVHVGEFEPFVKSLKDEDQRREWQSHIHTLRQALALSPEAAARVRKAFVSIRGESAAEDLMEMVRGYDEQSLGSTPEEIKSGSLEKLLRWLGDDNLDYRVLAIHNLNEVTGTNYLFNYRPEQKSKQRKRALRKMWDRFENNELVPVATRDAR